MAKSVKLVVVIPVGPTCIIDYIVDSIHSITHYTTPDCQIIIVDDSGKDTGRALQELFQDLDVVKTPENYGKMGGLYISLSMGYSHAHRHYDFEALLRFDTDALVIGDRPEEDAIQLCESVVEKTDKQRDLVEFSYHGKSTNPTIFACLPNLRYLL